MMSELKQEYGEYYEQISTTAIKKELSSLTSKHLTLNLRLKKSAIKLIL